MKLKITTITLLIMCSSVFYVISQENIKTPDEQSSEIKSQLPEGKIWKLIWSDEFNGTQLDTTKWGYRLHLIQTRHETWTKKGAVLDGNGNLLLNLYEKDGQFYSSHIQTGENFMDRPGDRYQNSKFVWPIADMEKPKFVHKYGYYEIRCKLQTQEGWWSAFWLQSPVIGSSLNPAEAGVEMDIMENFTRDGIVSHNLHWSGYGKDHKHRGSGNLKIQQTDDGFHTFGLHWSPEAYVFYIDGKVSWKVEGPVSHREQFILIGTECMGYREGGPSDKLKKAKVPDSFTVDYVRVFDDMGDTIEK